MKKNSILRAAFFALLFVASLTAAAQYVVATGNHVRLRTGPSTGYPMLVWNSTGKPVWINKGDRLTAEDEIFSRKNIHRREIALGTECTDVFTSCL